MRFAGIVSLGNGCRANGEVAAPVRGSYTVIGWPLLCSVVLKFPCVAATCGVDEVTGDGMASRHSSYEYMKKVLLRPSYKCGITTGPSSSTPGSFWGYAARPLPTRFWSKVLAVRMVFLSSQ